MREAYDRDAGSPGMALTVVQLLVPGPGRVVDSSVDRELRTVKRPWLSVPTALSNVSGVPRPLVTSPLPSRSPMLSTAWFLDMAGSRAVLQPNHRIAISLRVLLVLVLFEVAGMTARAEGLQIRPLPDDHFIVQGVTANAVRIARVIPGVASGRMIESHRAPIVRIVAIRTIPGRAAEVIRGNVSRVTVGAGLGDVRVVEGGVLPVPRVVAELAVIRARDVLVMLAPGVDPVVAGNASVADS